MMQFYCTLPTQLPTLILNDRAENSLICNYKKDHEDKKKEEEGKPFRKVRT